VIFLISSNVHENPPLIAASAVAGRVLYSELERDSHLPEIDASAIFRSRFAQHLAFLNLPRNDSEIAFGAPEYCLAISIKVSIVSVSRRERSVLQLKDRVLCPSLFWVAMAFAGGRLHCIYLLADMTFRLSTTCRVETSTN
jgi:hypothetical protein